MGKKHIKSKFKKSKIIALICLIMLIVFEILAIRESKAEKVINVSLIYADSDKSLIDEREEIQLRNKNGYSFVLPEYIANKKVSEYYLEVIEENNNVEKSNVEVKNEIINIEKNNIEVKDEITNTEKQNVEVKEDITNKEKQNVVIKNEITNTEKNNVEVKEEITNKEKQNVEIKNEITNIEKNNVEIKNEITNTEKNNIDVKNKNKKENKKENKKTESRKTIVKKPNDVVYLNKEQIKNKQIKIIVKYNKQNINNQVLYEQIIKSTVDENNDGMIDRTVKIEGFMPLESIVNVRIVGIQEIESKIKQHLNDKVSFKKAYDITISNNGKEYEPNAFDKNVKVSIQGVDNINPKKQKYKVVHIEKDNTTEEIKNVKSNKDVLTFNANSFSTYAVLMDESANLLSAYSMKLDNASVWDGSVSSGFKFGQGTQSDPYLIINASELAYLAQQVNNGVNYNNKYIELINDINLNNLEWTPIGNYNNPFRGNFNGNGYTIGNAKISTVSTIENNVKSYGLFGSIGNGANKTVIKNLQVDNSIIELKASGSIPGNNTDKGFHLGIVAGTIYNNADIINVIVNNSNISNSNLITITTNTMQIFAGGIAGFMMNGPNSTEKLIKPSLIENCYSNVDVTINIEPQSGWFSTRYEYLAQCSIGGIIGGIRNQKLWPKNCLYRGNLNSDNSFTGPIFGTLRGNSELGSRNNYENQFDILWQGNDLGNLNMQSFYTSFSTNNRAFSVSLAKGDSNNRVDNRYYMGYVQGVNKGKYIANSSDMLNKFNTYVNNNVNKKYLKWKYDVNTDAFYFEPEIKLDVRKNTPEYKVLINGQDITQGYTFKWYINNAYQSNISGNSLIKESNWTDEYNVDVLVKNTNGYAAISFKIEKLELHIAFEMNNQSNTLKARIEGTGRNDPNFNYNDYTYKWYKIDLVEDEILVEGANTLEISNPEEGMDYKIVGTNSKYSYMNVEGRYVNSNRTVVFVNETSGLNSNDGYTPNTPVQDFATAYGKLRSEGTRNQNIIVLMGKYTDRSFLRQERSNVYNKNVTITGKYKGINYNSVLNFEASNQYKFLNGNTTFMFLTFDGSVDALFFKTPSQTYFYLQGYDLTMGDGIVMNQYSEANTNQGLIQGSAPAFHIFAGWLKYDERRLPRTNGKILIKSGTYARVLLGGSTGTVGESSLQNNVSHNFMGSSLTDDLYKAELTVDIKNSTTPSKYKYDINLLGGGSTCGNIYGDVTLNIKNGKVGRLLGASIGDSGDRPSGWKHPINTFIGKATINMTGGSVTEMYGGCLGRNMKDIDNPNSSQTPILCDSYFYGTVNINISGGTVNQTIYGAGAGGVSGYSANSTDKYKEKYGKGVNTVININITGGTINADIYGGGYGYTNYLTRRSTQPDGGTLYGNSNINISGSPTINGSIYGGGRGYDLGSGKPKLAVMEGTSNITISGTPNITGQIYGAGMGLNNYPDMAEQKGTTVVNLNSNINTNVYGGGNIARTTGNTRININSGNHANEIYGGGNLGKLNGDSNIYINGGTNQTIFGAGNREGANNTNIYVKGGDTQTIYGGANQLGDVQKTNIVTEAGIVKNIFGGNNLGGNCQNTNVTINSNSQITEAVYGGGNQVATLNTNVILNSSKNPIPNIYGGGKAADATTTNVLVNGGKATNVFGGSNTSGNVTNSNVNVKNGTLENVYGGNNQGGITDTSNIIIDAGNINNCFGGGNQAKTNNSNILTKGGNIVNVYGGANLADVTTTTVNINGGKITNVFGGSNQNGVVTTSNVNTTLGEINSLYGGNNLGGTTTTTNINAAGGTINNAYGGGNQANIVNSNVLINNDSNILNNVYGGGNKALTQENTKVEILGGNINGNVFGGGNEGKVNKNTLVNIKNGSIKLSVYGGGNQAETGENTKVEILGGTIEGNVYGGGNEGKVIKDTLVHVKDANIISSVYGAGNGKTAIVFGNAKVIIDGTNTNIGQNVFGGGNQAETGEEIKNTSLCTVNIVGGNIGKNVYGGANTSVVYGNTLTNIGYDAVNDPSLVKGNVIINGTVFGGGEANASGSEIYDFSFISVTKGIDININGNTHDIFQIKGSIFGSGNASSTSGYSKINIKNYGTAYAPRKNISIQRTDMLTIDNSTIALSGAKDRTNEYSDVDFTLSRVDEVKLKNNSTLYLDCGANLLKKFNSLVDENGVEVKAKVTIDDKTGNTTRNVDNRLYMLEGTNLNIATNEQVSAYGEVNGMTFFGIYTNTNSPSTSTGLYNQEYNNGDKIKNEGTFSSNSYVRGLHKTNHNIKEDGFYSNYNEKENLGFIRTRYIDTTPKDDLYYIWLVGIEMDVTVFEVSLTASKYATLGTYELGLLGFAEPNTKFVLTGFSAGLNEGISLVNPKEIESIEQDKNRANSVFGLSMRTTKTGWMSDSKTMFLTENGGKYEGNTSYWSDNSTYTPALSLCLYHSENISLARKLGFVKIRFQAQIPKDDLNMEIKYIDIKVKMSTALYQDDFFEAAIAPGEEFGLFTTTETNITDSSVFSTYYSLFIPDFSENKHFAKYKNYRHVLVSRKNTGEKYIFPEKTKITMIDMETNNYYYYVVTKNDEQTGKYMYRLEDFLLMGSDSVYYDEIAAMNKYHNVDQNLVYENFIFHVDFSENNIPGDLNQNSLLMELQDSENQTLIGVLGIQRGAVVYSVYKNKDAIINVTANSNKNTVYLGSKFDLNVYTEFTQDVVASKTIYDTKYFDQKVGIIISIYDINGNRLNSDSLLGVSFELNGIKYYPRVDGTIRICISDRVTNVYSRITCDSGTNAKIATGEYTIQVESFSSPDGIYYGDIVSDKTSVNIKIIESTYGLKVYSASDEKIYNWQNGINANNTNKINLTMEYSAELKNPNLVLALERRNYDTVYAQDYYKVNLIDYTIVKTYEPKKENEYIIERTPKGKMNFGITLAKNLMTGTYKLVVKLYDGDEYIGEDYEYLIIK